MPTLNQVIARALEDDMSRQSDAECRTVLKAAKEEAATILQIARRTARQRVHAAIVAIRQEAQQRLTEAEAARHTRERMRSDEATVEFLRRTCPHLADAVLARWRDAAAREDWVRAAARVAAARLITKQWTVFHPPGFTDENRHCFLDAAGSGGDLANEAALGETTIAFELDTKLSAGIRVQAPGAVIDTTPEALLANRAITEGLLLAEIAACCRPDAGEES